MVLGQYSSSKLQHLFSQHKGILVPSKMSVRERKIVHGHACSAKRVTINQSKALKKISFTNLRMVLGQHSSSKLQHLFLQHESIRVPSQTGVR
jgi:hypothetical protein